MNTVKSVILSLAALVVFVSVAEVTLRILRFPPVLIDDKVKALTECWKETNEYHKNYHFNRLGLRGNKEILPKQDDVYRIVCIGDSWTFGLNVPKDKSYPALLEDFLKKSVPKMEIEVVNAGKPGYTLEEMIHFLEKNIDVLTPDCIIFWGGMNGIMTHKSDPEDNRYLNFYLSKVGSFLSKSYLYNGLSDSLEIIENFVKPIFPGAYQKSSREKRVITFCADFLDLKQKAGKTIVLLNYPLPKRMKGVLYGGYQEEYNQKSFPKSKMLKLLLKKNSNFIFIDLFNVFKKIENCNDLFLKMYYQHPNEEGYKIIADSIGKYLLKEIHFGKNIVE